MVTNEIVLPITKPQTEWVRGRAVRKMSPTRDHSRVQTEFAIVLAAAPAFAPSVAVEIRSPGDDPLDVASKLDVYLRGGSEFVLVADPIKRTMMLHDPVSVIAFAGNDVLEDQGLPGFELTVGPFFAAALVIAT